MKEKGEYKWGEGQEEWREEENLKQTMLSAEPNLGLHHHGDHDLS